MALSFDLWKKVIGEMALSFDFWKKVIGEMVIFVRYD